MPHDVQFTVLITLFAAAVQTVNFVLKELLKINVTGRTNVISFVLALVLFSCLIIETRRLFGFLR